MKTWQYNHINRLRRSLSIRLLTALLIMGALPQAWADEKANSKQSKEDLADLQQLLKMPQEDLKRVRLTLETIEKMSPAERRSALKHIQNLNKMPTEVRKETINRWNELSPEMKKAYFNYLRNLSASERKKFKAQPWDKQIEQVKKTGK